MELRLPTLLVLLLGFLLLPSCSKPKPHLSALASEPDWSRLSASAPSLLPGDSANSPGKGEGHYWREHPLRRTSPERPLAGLRIAIDPGHLGGRWARMEYRWFLPSEGKVIAEGDLTLWVAKKLERRLSEWGAEVFLVRKAAEPATPLPPEAWRGLAEKYLDEGKNLNLESRDNFQELSKEEQIRRVAEMLFYRVAEIRARAALVNAVFRPDLTICLHFNAGDWGNPEAPRTAKVNHLHVLVPGAAQPEEWALDDVRFEMVQRMLEGTYRVEIPLAESIADALAASTGLPPALVPGGAVQKIGKNPYVWARNLLANRLYESPTVFIEAYVMNHPETIARIAAGDYEGARKISEKSFTSIYTDYAEGVARGILDYYSPVK
ncbi:MAG: N-acetylmuramoyl-L-alanine amidase [Deltaproteobacteria bacterium]|nr:N-acetylmuramoyl-L-alanine amidase [Deltaproteobacteria bacterium]